MNNPQTRRFLEIFSEAFPLYPDGEARLEALTLLQNGAAPTPLDVSQHVDDEGEPIYAMHAAISNLDAEMVQALLDAGHPASLDIPDELFCDHDMSLATALQPLPAALQRWVIASEDGDLESCQQLVPIINALVAQGAPAFQADTFGFESAWNYWAVVVVNENNTMEGVPWSVVFRQVGEALVQSKDLDERFRQERLEALRTNKPIRFSEDQPLYDALVDMPRSKAWAAPFKAEHLEEQWDRPLPKKGPSPRF